MSTELFYYIMSITDNRDKRVEDIPLPKPKAILEVTSVEYAAPGRQFNGEKNLALVSA